MNTKTKKLVLAALLAALVCVATMVIKIPSPLKGFVNLGDCMVLAAGWLLSPAYGFLAAGLGSALADLLSSYAGYALYAPATFVIKGCMALMAYYGWRLLSRRIGDLPAAVLSGIVAEVWMIAGYFLFEGVLYGFVLMTANIPVNAVQGVAGLILGVVLKKVFTRYKLVE